MSGFSEGTSGSRTFGSFAIACSFLSQAVRDANGSCCGLLPNPFGRAETDSASDDTEESVDPIEVTKQGVCYASL